MKHVPTVYYTISCASQEKKVAGHAVVMIFLEELKGVALRLWF